MSRPIALPSASASTLVEPQSTQTMSRAPALASDADRLGVRPVALEQPVGDVDHRVAPDRPQVAGEQRRRGRAVDVVVAEDRHRLAVDHGVGDPRRRNVHRGQHRGVGQEPLQRRIEEVRDVVRRDAAPGEHPRHDIGQRVALGDGQRVPRLMFVEPRHPAPPGQRPLDAEEGAVGGIGTGKGHEHRGRGRSDLRQAGVYRGATTAPGARTPQRIREERPTTADREAGIGTVPTRHRGVQRLAGDDRQSARRGVSTLTRIQGRGRTTPACHPRESGDPVTAA